MTKGVKKNRSSAHKNNMECRCCDSGEDETQEHLEVCEATGNRRRRLGEVADPIDVLEEIEEKKKMKMEEKAQMRTGCKAEITKRLRLQAK